jgi:hypothetical protein
MCVIAALMVQARRSNATIWLEVVDYFDGMSPDEFFHHFFVSPMRYYYLGGPDNWVFDKYLRQRKGLNMTHKRAVKGQGQTLATNDFKGFVSYDLTDDQWTEFDKAFPRTFTAPQIWNDVLVTHKLTVTPKEGNFNACLWPQSGPNAGYGLSAFADSAFEAMAIVLYKFHLVKDTSWSELVTNKKRARG